LYPSFETLAEFIIGPRFSADPVAAPQDEVNIFHRLSDQTYQSRYGESLGISVVMAGLVPAIHDLLYRA
jgi:hypothetical protein